MKNTILQPASLDQLDEIWKILQSAIKRRAEEGSEQWQNGYPNPQVITEDIENNNAYILKNEEDRIVAYVAVVKNNEPAYEKIEGNWLENGDFIAMHRIAIHPDFLGKGYIKILFAEAENLARKLNVTSIKIDTNFDNGPMLHLMDVLGYTYCGKINFWGGERMAFQKILN